ncbi:MAG: T9SS type A sorting domain-containing protein [Melioribacteraceae bacterium]|nr:T9SS type A sorting domain-containing protein [Melioribacteraceae bacterium]MCF8354872.1 T9SS type A sorting domain-containing protein [Melioribacteraceae bacterium]MCF8393906.1 T9SS type A sorting domain-containing protein [Melioribacteraceae bacterium]MCF8419678.1 T9SS type A sorting domain-containing protein [Melioribacteraceae bacterium]
MYTSVYIANKWGDTHGFRRFWPGTDVMDLSFTQHNYETLEFNYRLLSESVGKVEILQNGSVVHTFSTPFVWSAGYYSETLDYSNLSPGSYQFRVTAKHWLDNQYKEYSQGFRIKTINFTVSPIPVPLIDHFVQDPKPICRGGTGRIIVYLRNENSTDYGDLKYYWSASNLPQDVELVQVPNYDKKYCTLVYHNTKLNSVNGDPIPPATITCTVTNQTGSDREEFSPIYFSTACSGGVECPTLSFTENDSMFTDNTLLIGSPDNPGVDIEDYYMVNERIKPQHKEVSFRIHEPEIAHTWLDNVDLLQVKAKPNENIAVTPEGEIISYKLPNKPFTIILNDSIDVTAILADRDDNSYTFENGDVLKLILGNKYKAGTTSYVVVDAYKPPPKEQEFAEIKTKYNKQAPGFNGIEDKDFGLFNLRPYKSTVCKKLDSALGDTLLVEILQYGTIDLFTIAADEQTARVNELGLVSAVHSTYGDVKNALTSTDETYSEILPGEGIDIKFATPNNGIGNFRYILHVTGRYTEGDSMFIAKQTAGENRGLIPEKTELVGAYPNPFNPSTTIEYTLKKDSPVTLKVYDILGSEVATLVNREEPAGRYSVIFNAAAINGGLPSGVYIYRFQAGEYSDVKKMLLVK